MADFEHIAVVGMGYVGLPLSLRFAEAGVQVFGIDINAQRVASINAGRSGMCHFPDDFVRQAVDRGQLRATTDFAVIQEAQAVIICVPTPLDKRRNPDLSYVLQTAESIRPFLKSPSQPKLVVLESTTYPGTTDTELRSALEKGGLSAGTDFYLAYSPEREDPGRDDATVQTIPKVIGGYTPQCLEACMRLYGKAIDTLVPVSSCRVAEASKLTENIFRSVNIALVNELKVIYDAMAIDVWEVIEAASSKPFGFMPFYPGPGIGGHCIPVDPFYLTHKAREFEMNTHFIELAGEVNVQMFDYVQMKVMNALNDMGKSVRGSKILLLGLAYKPEVDDCRESPSFPIWRKLAGLGAEVSYHDPFVPVVPGKRDFPEFSGLKSAPVEDEYDLLLLLTHHRCYREMDFSGFDAVLVDTRNCVAENHRPRGYRKA